MILSAWADGRRPALKNGTGNDTQPASVRTTPGLSRALRHLQIRANLPARRLQSAVSPPLLFPQIEQLNPAQVPSALKTSLEPHAHDLQSILLRHHPLAE